MADEDWVDELSERLPRHGRLVRALRDAVAGDERWRWFDVACSLGAGGGDELSDIDAAVGYSDVLDVDEAAEAAREMVGGVGEVIDVLVHSIEGWPSDLCRLADTYPVPTDRSSLVAAARSVAALLDECVAMAAEHLGHRLSTGWRDAALRRLETATA